MTNLARGAAALALLWMIACSAQSATNPGEDRAQPPPSTKPLTATSLVPAQPAATDASGSAATGTVTAADAGTDGGPAASALATTDAGAGTDAGAAPQSAEEPIPDVKVTNIGMHIGGGKNDASEKDPIRRSVEPHFDAFKRCFAKASEPTKSGDVSVDLRVDKAGGKAKLTKYKATLKGAEFEACVRATFEAIDFRKPKDGTTNVSYSLRFVPKAR